MQIKTTMSFHITPVRMVKIKKEKKLTPNAGKYVEEEKGKPHSVLVGLQTDETTLDNSVEHFKKAKKRPINTSHTTFLSYVQRPAE